MKVLPEFVDEYAVIKSSIPHDIRYKARNIALDMLSLGIKLTHGYDNLLSKPRIQFLYIHHVFKDEESAFVNLLTALSRYHIFISYTEAWTRLRNGKVDKPYIAFSSDDGLKNNLRAATILKDFGASACFFVCPSIIGVNDFRKVESFSNERLHLPAVEFMDWDDVNRLMKEGHEIGSHTMSHINIAKTSNDHLVYEINESKRILDNNCGNTLHFAYPYGRHFHFNEAGKQIVFKSGFMSCASAERGCHIVPLEGVKNNEGLLIRRDHVILDWTIDHVFYFLARNAMKAKITNNNFPLYEDSSVNK